MPSPSPSTPGPTAPAFDPVIAARQVLAEAVRRYHPVKVFALFSGGHDSLCAAHLASTMPRFDGCVHINTGIGVEETRQFVRRTCRERGWPLREYAPPVSYDEIVLRWGFPGPAGHTLIYNRLKERCLRQLVREHKRGWGDHVLLVTGVRRQESRRRMGRVVPLQKEGARVCVAPLVNWSSQDKEAYLDGHRLRRNEVVAKLWMSGERLCGAFAKKEEIREIELWYPEVAARIHALEAKAKKVGVHHVWGTRPPRQAKQPLSARDRLGLCWSCEAKKERLEEAAFKGLRLPACSPGRAADGQGLTAMRPGNADVPL